MRTSPVLSGGLLLTWFVVGAPTARAEMIDWSYSWTRTPKQLAADSPSPNNPATGSINLFPPLSGTATNTSDIIAFNLSTSSRATNALPDLYTNKQFQMSLTITDTASNKSGTVNFSGSISGSVSVGSANLSGHFDSPAVQELMLGAHLYTITLNPFTPPGNPGATLLGAVGAHVAVTTPDNGGGNHGVETVPEPSTLLLAALGCGGSLAAAWRKRRRAAV